MLVEVWGDVFEAIWMLSEERWGSWESGPCLLGDRPPPAGHTCANAGSDRIIMGSFSLEAGRGCPVDACRRAMWSRRACCTLRERTAASTLRDRLTTCRRHLDATCCLMAKEAVGNEDDASEARWNVG